ncbi:MAG: hypothetical protein H7196_04950 [candidate division SR1 bacterium]|nr:hypothetical protein [candidate division SR1 bacterium]
MTTPPDGLPLSFAVNTLFEVMFPLVVVLAALTELLAVTLAAVTEPPAYTFPVAGILEFVLIVPFTSSG